jgi:hypothetical protein
MKYLIKGKTILLLLSMLFLTNSCVEMYCALSDSVSDFCYDVRRRENEKMDKREEKVKEREHRKKWKK